MINVEETIEFVQLVHAIEELKQQNDELYKELTNANEWLKRLRANVKDGYASLPVNITALDATMLYVKQALALVEKEE